MGAPGWILIQKVIEIIIKHHYQINEKNDKLRVIAGFKPFLPILLFLTFTVRKAVDESAASAVHPETDRSYPDDSACNRQALRHSRSRLWLAAEASAAAAAGAEPGRRADAGGGTGGCRCHRGTDLRRNPASVADHPRGLLVGRHHRCRWPVDHHSAQPAGGSAGEPADAVAIGGSGARGLQGAGADRSGQVG